MFEPLCYNTRCTLCNVQLEENAITTYDIEPYCETCVSSIMRTKSQDVLLYGRQPDPFEEEIT